jgi:hypothetical protein
MTRDEEPDWSVAMEAIETPDTSAIACHREELHRKAVELMFLSRRNTALTRNQILGLPTAS